MEHDEFGTHLDHPFAKHKWVNMRQGQPERGTGFMMYVQQFKEQLPEISDAAFEALQAKYRNLYGREMPWAKSGEIPAEGGNPDPENTSGGGSPDPQDTTGGGGPVEDGGGDQETGEVLMSDASAQLAELAGKHRREYLTVVRGRTPKSVDQILAWMDEINELVVFNQKGQKNQSGQDGEEGKF